MVRSGLALFVGVVVHGAALEHPAYAQEPQTTIQQWQETVTAPDVAGLKMLVIAGESGVNIIRKKTAVQPVMEVRDPNDTPVSSVVVNFITPTGNPSAVFSNGGRTLSLLTDSEGRAAVTGMQPVGTGAFRITVSANLAGRVLATTNIAQTNFATVAAAASSGAVASTGASSARLSAGVITAIVASVAAAAVLGGVLATRGGASGAANAPAATIGLTTGTGTVGPPH